MPRGPSITVGPGSPEYNRGVHPPSPAAAPSAAARPAWAGALLGAVLAVAFLLRVAGLSYGMPDWVYHSDTSKQLQRVVPFMRGQLVPEDTYPVLHMYLTALVLRAGALVDPHGPAGRPSWPQVVVSARLVNAALGTATVALLAVAARRLFGWRIGLLAAGLLALSPVSIVHAHYEMGDVPQTFFVVAAVAAAAAALRGGGPVALLATGALAGLAAGAKFFGVVVIATAVVAAWGGSRRSPAQIGVLLAGAGLAGLAAFVLSTPLLLLEPGRWLAQIEQSPELFLGMPLSPLERLGLGGRVVVGLVLTWFGAPLCLAALAGAVVLARREWPGALVLVTPAIVLGIYVWFRPHGLDDRYLVILAPFAALAAAVAVAALARWSRRAALVAALALFAVGTVDALHVAYLFWTDDTREHALRWRRRHVPPDDPPGRTARLGARRSADPGRPAPQHRHAERRSVPCLVLGAAPGADPSGPGDARARGQAPATVRAPAPGLHRADDRLLRPGVDAGPVRLPAPGRRRHGRGGHLRRSRRGAGPRRRRRDTGASAHAGPSFRGRPCRGSRSP